MSDTSFSKKLLRATIKLSTGTFDGTSSNAVTLFGQRMAAEMINPGGESMGQLQLRVFGMTQAMMNELTRIGGFNRVNPANQILLEAGDDPSRMHLVFSGTIYDAWGDYSGQPDVAFTVVAYMGMDALLKPVEPYSSSLASADVATIMSDLAKTMGLIFENNGVQRKLNYPYFPGTALNQVRLCARAAQISYNIDRGVLAIWETANGRDGEIPLISPATGMVGYPQAMSGGGMTIKTVFNWNIRQGGFAQLDSSIPMARGKFNVNNLTHSLSSGVIDGPWFTTFVCYAKP